MIGKFAVCASVFQTLLSGNNSATGGARGSRIAGGVAARGGQFRGKTVRLCNIKTLHFAKITTPIGELGFDSVQKCSVKV